MEVGISLLAVVLSSAFLSLPLALPEKHLSLILLYIIRVKVVKNVG